MASRLQRCIQDPALGCARRHAACIRFFLSATATRSCNCAVSFVSLGDLHRCCRRRSRACRALAARCVSASRSSALFSCSRSSRALRFYTRTTRANYLVGAMPFAALALLELFALIPRQALGAALAVVMLGALTLVGGLAIGRAAASDPRGAAADSHLSRVARQMLPKNGIAVGDYVYWWLFRDDRFRFNADIWFREYHEHLTFEPGVLACMP